MYLFGVAATGLPFFYGFKQAENSIITLSRPEYLSHICNEAMLIEIGKAYKAKFPSESDTRQLLNLLLTDSHGNRLSASADDKKIKSFLSKKIGQEIGNGKTVVVNGWVISVTEARQCSLLTNQHVY